MPDKEAATEDREETDPSSATSSQQQEPTGTSKIRKTVPIVVVSLNKAEGLIGKRGDGLSNPYALVSVSSRKGNWHQTATIHGTNDPEWNETFAFYTSRDDLLQETATTAEYQKIIDKNPLFNRNIQSQNPMVQVQIYSRPSHKDSDNSAQLPPTEEAEISESPDATPSAEVDALAEHKYSQRHRFLGRAEMGLTQLLDKAMMSHNTAMKGPIYVTETLDLKKRSRNSHVSGSISITVSVQMWNVKDITRKSIRSLQHSSGSLPTSPVHGAPEGSAHQAPMHLTSFISSEFQMPDDIAEGDLLCHKAKCKSDSENQSISASSNKRTFQYLMVNVVKASQLAIKDTWKMSSDPFCRLHLGNLKERTKTVPRDLNPTWNESFAFSLAEDKDWLLRDLVVSVWDEDFGGVSSDFLGEVKIPMWILTTSPSFSLQHPKANSASEISMGEISSIPQNHGAGNSAAGDNLMQILRWISGTKSGSDQKQNTTQHRASQAEITRPQEEWLILEGRSRKSVVRGSICLRVWLVEENDPELPSAKIISRTPISNGGTISKKSSKNDLKASNGHDQDLAPILENPKPRWSIRKKSSRHSDSTGEITSSTALQRGGVYIEEAIEIVRLSIIGAKGLPKTDIGGKTDAYCKIIMRDVEMKTSVQYRTFDPYWGEHFILAVRRSDLAKSSIRVEVWDHDHLNDEFVGHFTIPLKSLESRYTFWKKNEKNYTAQDALKALRRTSSVSFSNGDTDSDYDKKLPIRCKPRTYSVQRPASKKRNHENRDGEVDISCHIDLDAHLEDSRQAPIAQLHISVLSASNFLPKDSKVQGVNTFCVLHLGGNWGRNEGPSWARTRLVYDNINPIWGETFSFDVMDAANVLSLALVDDSGSSMFYSKSVVIGLMRLRLSTLMPNRLYRGKFPMLRRGGNRGVEVAGEVMLAVKLQVDDMTKYALSYSKPMLPAIVHLEESLNDFNVSERLRQGREDMVKRTLEEQGAHIDPDVLHEILEDQQLFVHQISMGISRQKFMMRLAKAHVNRILGAIEAIQSFFLVSVITDILDWKNLYASLSANILFVFLVYHSYLIIPLVLFSIAVRGMVLFKNAYRRPDPFTPPLMDLTLSLGDSDSDDEEEENPDIDSLHKAGTASPSKLDSESASALADADADDSVDTGDNGPGIDRSLSINSINIIAETEPGEETMDGAFSSYVQLRNSSRKQTLTSRLRKVNPVAIYKDIKSQLDSLKERARKVQHLLSSLAVNLEKIQKLLSWHDPVGSGIFYLLLVVIGILFLLLGPRFIISALGLYLMRHPSLIDPLPPKPFNLFVRLPNRTDQML